MSAEAIVLAAIVLGVFVQLVVPFADPTRDEE